MNDCHSELLIARTSPQPTIILSEIDEATSDVATVEAGAAMAKVKNLPSYIHSWWIQLSVFILE